MNVNEPDKLEQVTTWVQEVTAELESGLNWLGNHWRYWQACLLSPCSVWRRSLLPWSAGTIASLRFRGGDMLLDAEWMTPLLFGLIGLVVVGFVLIFIGRTIENDARVGTDNEYNRTRKRHGRRYVAGGVIVALFCGLAAVAVAWFTLMPL